MQSITMEELKRAMQRTVLDAKDRPTVDELKALLVAGGGQLLREDEAFCKEFINNILTHENQYVVIYENYHMAARFFDLYHAVLEEI